MPDKVRTTMVLKVDLQCSKCYKKVKKVLCKFPQIQDQVYDEKKNTVTIKVVCCCPEKMMNKILCKAGAVITCIEIKPPVVETKPEEPKKEPEKKNPDKPPDKPKEDPTKHVPPCRCHPPPPRLPCGVCCARCYGGGPRCGGGPIWCPCYYYGYGMPVYDSWGGYGCRSVYVCEEYGSSSSCAIM